MTEPYFIAIEGNIGAGKTTLAKLLANALNARLILEQFAENPFLYEFYRNPERWAFAVEMAFMAERYKQLHGIVDKIDLFQPVLVSDYHPLKSKLFSSVNLDEREFYLFEKFFDTLFQKIRQPDLVIFLSADIPTLLRNINNRDRWFEKGITPEYLQRISDGYSLFLKTLNVPVLILKRESFDFLRFEDHLIAIVHAIETRKIKGRLYVSALEELENL
ncbi:MAG: deoxynucleoside kinase [Thermaurantimonas sp.]